MSKPVKKSTTSKKQKGAGWWPFNNNNLQTLNILVAQLGAKLNNIPANTSDQTIIDIRMWHKQVYTLIQNNHPFTPQQIKYWIDNLKRYNSYLDNYTAKRNTSLTGGRSKKKTTSKK